MLDNRVRAELEKSLSRSTGAAVAAMSAIAVALMALAGIKLFLAERWGNLDSHPPAYVLQQWLAGPQPNRMYSGILLRAIHDVDGACIVPLLVVLVSGTAAGLRRQRRQSQRIIEELRRLGAW